MKLPRILITPAIVWLVTALSGVAQTGPPRDSAPAGAEARQTGEAAPLIFWNRKITDFRA
jgi:hypothetical protein